MKRYEKPEVRTICFSSVDVICTSTGDDGSEEKARRLKTVVAGNEGVSYGAQDVSLLD